MVDFMLKLSGGLPQDLTFLSQITLFSSKVLFYLVKVRNKSVTNLSQICHRSEKCSFTS